MNENVPGVRTSFRLRHLKKLKRIIIFSVAVILILVLLFVVVHNVSSRSDTPATNTAASPAVSQQAQLPPPVSSQTIDRTFQFSVNDKTGKLITSFNYKILNAQLMDAVIINGQKYYPVQGKTFLVINLEITNNYTQTITIQPRDYIRIMMDKSSEKLAPDIYNDPVDVQAISTKPSKLSLAISTTDKDLIMQVGEITGSKTSIPLTLQYK